MRQRNIDRIAAALALALVLGLPLAAAAQSKEVRISGQSVETRQLATPEKGVDAQGVTRTYDQVLVVRLKGDFPRDRDLGLRLYVGDWQVPEYGGTPDGLYFKVYDPKLLEGLKGKELRYRLGDEPVRSAGVPFDPAPVKP